MYRQQQILRVLFVPAASLVAENKQCKTAGAATPEKPLIEKCKPSELPIYVKEAQSQLNEEPPSTALQETIGKVRIQVNGVLKEVNAYRRVGEGFVEHSLTNLDGLVKYLREENNTMPKAGAIAIGGLTGLIFGLRGRIVKRVVYASTGALAMASICYPKAAAEYSQIGIAETKKYATIVYNFAYGVKKDDPPLQLPSLPQLPSSFSEAWDIISKSALNLVSGQDEKASSTQKTSSPTIPPLNNTTFK